VYFSVCTLYFQERERKIKRWTAKGTGLLNPGFLTEIGLDYGVSPPYWQLESGRTMMEKFNWTAKFREKLKRRFICAKALYKDPGCYFRKVLKVLESHHLDLEGKWEIP